MRLAQVESSTRVVSLDKHAPPNLSSLTSGSLHHPKISTWSRSEGPAITIASEAAKQSSTSVSGTPLIASPRGVNTPVPEQFDLGSPMTAQGDENEKKLKEI